MPETNLYDEKLLFRQVAHGDELAFRKVFYLYKEKLSLFISRMVKSDAATTELVQEIFVKLWVNREKLAKVDHPGAYIFMMANNRAVDHLRKIASEARMMDEVWQRISQVQHSTEERLQAKESQELINRAVVQLSPQKQKIFSLSRYEGLNHEEIASELRLSKSTVKNHLVETLRHIRTYLLRNSGSLLIVFSALLRFFLV